MSLEASLLSENIAGVSGDVASKISISRVITNITTDIHFGIHRFDFNFISEILKTFKTTFERTNSNEQRLKILERFFKFYIKYQGSTTSFLQMMTDHKAGNERPSLDPKQKAYAQKFKNITKLMKKFLTELIADNQAQKHFDLETLSNDFIMFLFKSLSQVNSMHLDVDKITSDADTNNNIKDNPKNPIYYLNFLYHLIKQNCHTKLIYNLISSRFSLKSCLGQLKQTLTHKDEKSFDQVILIFSLLDRSS